MIELWLLITTVVVCLVLALIAYAIYNKIKDRPCRPMLPDDDNEDYNWELKQERSGRLFDVYFRQIFRALAISAVSFIVLWNCSLVNQTTVIAAILIPQCIVFTWFYYRLDQSKYWAEYD